MAVSVLRPLAFFDVIFAQENRSVRNNTNGPILPGGGKAQENRSVRNDTNGPILPGGGTNTPQTHEFIDDFIARPASNPDFIYNSNYSPLAFFVFLIFLFFWLLFFFFVFLIFFSHVQV